jgi:hypothetical protein
VCLSRLFSGFMELRWFDQQNPQLLSCSETEVRFAFASAVRAGLETHCLCITLTKSPFTSTMTSEECTSVVFQDETGKHVFSNSCRQSVRNCDRMFYEASFN